MSRKVYIDNMPLDQALELLRTRLAQTSALTVKTETVPVIASRGRISAEPVWARHSSPNYAASAMDGIAVRAADTFSARETNPVVLKRDVQFIEVDTGDPIPRDFDAVVMIEDVNFNSPETAEIIVAATPWQHIRSVGEDVIASQMLLPAGFLIGPYEIGSFLTAGVREVVVARRPKVVIIPTGTELVEPGSETGEAGEITESNSRMLAALCEEWGADPTRFPIVIDDRELLADAVSKAAEIADMIVVCSGSSAGREDFTADTVARLGELLLHGIATRPGKPSILGIVNQKPVVGVPGYPVSAALVFELFAHPLICAMQGISQPAETRLNARLTRKMSSPMGSDEFANVNLARVGEDILAFPLNRGAGITTSLVKADGVLLIPRGVEGYQAGDTVQILLKRPSDLIERTLLAIGSHDLALDSLSNILWNRHGIRLSSSNVGSLGGIMSLKRRETHLAGIHLLDTETGDYNLSYLKKYLTGERILLVNLLWRQQGFMVKPGNPLCIRNISDLTQNGIRYVNRQKGSGTRILFDYLLKRDGLPTGAIHGYEREEYSHLAVAAAVKNDTADAALGILAGAKALGLDFVPAEEERYDLCVLPELAGEAPVAALMEAIADPKFTAQVKAMGGYDLRDSGRTLWDGVL
ncbi:MAG: molybdopterin biosynthesis protein [Solirubrobacterales bacterium]